MTTTIRGKLGKESLIALLRQHDECQFVFDEAKKSEEPYRLQSADRNFGMDISKSELMTLLSNRMQDINTKLENLGLKIGDEVMENA